MRRPTPVLTRRFCGVSEGGGGSGRRTTLGLSAPSANLVIHRPCGRRARCCGELRKTCARPGGQACEQALSPLHKLALSCTFPVHRLCRRKTFPGGPRSLRPVHTDTPEPNISKGHSRIASLTCGRLDWWP